MEIQNLLVNISFVFELELVERPFIILRSSLNPYQLFAFLSPEYKKTERMTWSDFLSNIGGLCGLCLGFSFMSGIEIIYWIFKIVKNVVS